MRISDWSSDVCSSDLPGAPRLRRMGSAPVSGEAAAAVARAARNAGTDLLSPTGHAWRDRRRARCRDVAAHHPPAARSLLDPRTRTQGGAGPALAVRPPPPTM